MEILFLGGTQFVGRHMVEVALERGHTPIIFHRGKTGTDLFPEVERIQGDRDGGLDSLRGRSFDAVVDVSGYLPRIVKDSVDLLADAADRYLFISTVAVYEPTPEAGLTEDAPLIALDDPTTETIDGKTYGGLKVLCEEAVSEGFGGRSIIIRPGYIVGPADHTDRFTYWLRRIAEGGPFLAPGSPDDPLQWIDARDLAAFTIHALEAPLGGVFTVTGPADPTTWGAFFEAARETFGSDAKPVWGDRPFLREQEVTGIDVPMTTPETHRGWATVSLDRAIGAGLRYRPAAETYRDTLEADRALPADAKRTGLTREREAELLAALSARD